MHQEVKVRLELPEGVSLGKAEGTVLAAAMEGEVNAFEEWFEGQGNAPLVNVERSIIRTYIAWKLRYENEG